MRIYIFTGFCFVLLLSGACATDVANRYYSTAHYPAKPAEKVELLGAAPNRSYEVIADFQSRNESPESIREKAAQIGADAVIVTTLGGRYDKTEEWAAQGKNRAMYTRIVGTAIKYK